MTNQEYEAASIAAAGCYGKFEGEHKLKQIDEHIAQLEKTIATLNEMRREIVNQYNLNKAEGRWSSSSGQVQQLQRNADNLNKCGHSSWEDMSNGCRRCCDCMEVLE